MITQRLPLVLTLVVLIATTGMQTLAANSLFVIPAIAPAIAGDLGLPTALIGYQVSSVYLGAMIISVMAGSITANWGPIRAAQASLLLGAIGLAIATISTFTTFIIGSLAIGAGYGLINPPSGHMLEKVSNSSNRSMLFSIKQTAVPIGGVMAGLVGPPIALLYSWKVALLVSGGLSIAMIGLLQFLSGYFDSYREAKTSWLRDSPFQDLALVWKSSTLRWLTLSAFCYAAVQFTLTTYLVTLLVEDVRLNLVAAGVALSVFQIAAIIGRIGWGVIADFTRSGLAVLVIAYGTAFLSIIPLIFMTSQWGLTAIYVSLAVLGFCGAGWNGVFVSQVVDFAPPNTASRAIGGAFVFTFAGALLGPSTFALAHDWFELYTRTAPVIALFSFVGFAFGFLALRAKNPAAAESESQ